MRILANFGFPRFYMTAMLLSVLLVYSETVTLEYSLNNFLKDVAADNPQRKVDQHDPLSARARYREVRDIFSPTLNAGVTHAENYYTNLLTGVVPSTNRIVSAGLQKIFAATGTVLKGSYNNVWFKQSQDVTVAHITSNADVIITNPGSQVPPVPATGMALPTTLIPIRTNIESESWSSHFEFTAVQPLLRNGPILTPGKKQIDLMKEQVRLARTVDNNKLEGLIFQSIMMYWQYQVNRKFLALSFASVQDTEAMLEKNRKRLAVGTVDITDIYDLEAMLAKSRADLDFARNELLELKEKIIYTIGRTDLQSGNVVLNFIDDIESPGWLEALPPKDEILNRAYTYRQDISRAGIQNKIAGLSLDIARITMLPKLDMFASAKIKGFDTNSFRESFESTAFDKKNLEFNAGIQFEMPLDLRAFKTVVEKAKIEKSKSEAAIDLLRRDIEAEINSLIRRAEYYRGKERADRETVLLMEKKREEFEKKYNNGKIEIDRYLRAQDDVRLWQRIRLGTLLQAILTDAQLDLAQGVLLSKYGITANNPMGKIR